MISLSTEFCTLAYFIVLVLKCLIHYLDVECPPYNIVISLYEGNFDNNGKTSYIVYLLFKETFTTLIILTNWQFQ